MRARSMIGHARSRPREDRADHRDGPDRSARKSRKPRFSTSMRRCSSCAPPLAARDCTGELTELGTSGAAADDRDASVRDDDKDQQVASAGGSRAFDEGRISGTRAFIRTAPCHSIADTFQRPIPGL
jgi:hypothetical protein